MSEERTLLIAQENPCAQRLAEALEADLETIPPEDDPEKQEEWRDGCASRDQRARIVLFVTGKESTSGTVLDQTESEWQARFEWPFLFWNLVLGASSRRIADGGSIVALVQTPAALDSAGWVPESSIADGVLALVRSVAASQGGRGVRVNLVTTPVGLVSRPVISPQPPLDCFPGEIEGEVAGAIRLLLSEDARGLTGRLLSADGGRSL
jgi:NAD(P)-dependent dehydrogenase (short-subunit alcohol dehydrogenase family)